MHMLVYYDTCMVCIYVCVYVYVCVYMYTYKYMCMDMYICTVIFTLFDPIYCYFCPGYLYS